jgi:hypothetical protein
MGFSRKTSWTRLIGFPIDPWAKQETLETRRSKTARREFIKQRGVVNE